MANYYAKGNDGVYSLNEIVRSVTKLAPDMFVTFNNSLGTSVSSTSPDSSQNAGVIGFKGGITSINVSGTIAPAGGGSCTLQVTSPPYTGLHTSYYMENPDGTKTPYFQPMMEVKVYAKGRYLATPREGQPGQANSPRYYPVFWGFVTGINEAYSGGNFTFTLTCKDMLHWWNYQNISVVPTGLNQQWGGGQIQPTGTNLRFMNPWELIFNLFYETGFDSLIYPTFTNGTENLPVITPKYTMTTSKDSPGAFEMLTKSAMSYWKKRFSASNIVPSGAVLDGGTDVIKKAYAGLEMFGLQGKLDLNTTFKLAPSDTFVNSRAANIPPKTPKTGDKTVPDGGSNTPPKADTQNSTTPQDSKDAKAVKATSQVSDSQVYRLSDSMEVTADVTLDFGLMGKVLPYGNFTENLPGPETTNATKLEIANTATQNIHLEFFQDMNGTFVFKPPFFNMDTSSTKTYRMLPEDIISMNESTETDGIVNALQVTGSFIQVANTIGPSAVHYDFGSIARFGLRFRSMKIPYGNNAKQLQSMAVSEMAITNSQTTTASMEIPLRPELRLGYPVYIDHLDCYYYIVSINHSFSFGSAATTSLTLNAKRSKVWNYEGDETTKSAIPMRAYIYMARDVYYRAKIKNSTGQEPTEDELRKAILADINGTSDPEKQRISGPSYPDTIKRSDTSENKVVEKNSDFTAGMSPSSIRDKDAGFISSPDPGFYVATKSPAYYSFVSSTSSNAVSPQNAVIGAENRSTNELVMYTEDSVPYTDVSGYHHIGAFPFGANLSMSDNYEFRDITQLGTGSVFDLKDIYNIRPEGAVDTKDGAATDGNTVPVENQEESDESGSAGTVGNTAPMVALVLGVEPVTNPDGTVTDRAVAAPSEVVSPELIERMYAERAAAKTAEAKRTADLNVDAAKALHLTSISEVLVRSQQATRKEN